MKGGGSIKLSIVTPSEAENAKFGFDGKTHEVEIGLSATVKQLKEQLAGMLGGLAANKQKLQTARHGVLKDGSSLAHYNFSSGDKLEIGLKTRGGKK